MRTPFIILALSIPLIATPVEAQDFLGRLARRTAETATQNLADQATRGTASKRAKKTTAPTPAPAEEVPQESAPSAGSGLVVKNDMAVISSDGAKVAVVNHVPGGSRAYGPDEMFFTADPYYKLRRIYGREVSVSGGTVRLKMNAAQFRARNQNPD